MNAEAGTFGAVESPIGWIDSSGKKEAKDVGSSAVARRKDSRRQREMLTHRERITSARKVAEDQVKKQEEVIGEVRKR